MKQGVVLLGALLVLFSVGGARALAAEPRVTEDGQTLILLEEVREPQGKRQPGITLTGNRLTGGRQVRVAGHGIAPLQEMAAVCGGRSWRLGLSDFRQTPERNVATYEVPGEVVTQVLNSPECALLIAGARILIPRELVSAVWGLPGSAQQLVPGSSAAASAPTATPAEPCAVRTPGGDPSRISPGERIRSIKAIEALGALRDWANGPQGKGKADYASRVAKAEMVVDEYLAGGQGGQGELASAIRAAMNCFKEALQAWPQVNQPWSSAAENVRGTERYLNVKPLAERQEEERTKRMELEAKQQEAKQRKANTGFLSQTDKKERAAAFAFADVKYFHRFTKDDQHEYTPDGQEDLKSWTDMVAILYYRKVKDGEALATTANAVLEIYKANKARVIRTDSVPLTKDKPAEHLIVAIFGRPEFLEVTFARFKMHDGVGSAVIYSHRVYGKTVGKEMSAWLEKNGPTAEKNLMKWDAMPKPPSPK